MGNVEALKALYVALGGAAEDVENLTLNSEVINALANVAAVVAGGILPEVTDADDGKVLTVQDGKWKAV
jgi:hypothetical protein